MKDKLLLYLSKLRDSKNIAISPTLAWIAEEKGYLFDNYYDSYHLGIHFPGGDWRNLESGQLTGGTVSGDRHFGEFYFLLLNFDVQVVSNGHTMFLPTVEHLNVPVVVISNEVDVFYQKILSHLGIPFPSTVVMVGFDPEGKLKGVGTYLYPEIYYRKAIGVPESITEDQLDNLCGGKAKILCCFVDDGKVKRLKSRGYDVDVIESFREGDSYSSITERVAKRWGGKVRGWILGDPTLILHWLPKACEEHLIAIYGIPQEDILSRLSDLISSQGEVVYGRQYSDRDFFELSKLNRCFQVIDPCRQPFQSTKHIGYSWNHVDEGFYKPEYSDEELEHFACEGKILISLMFWTGMIRELENLYELVDLIAVSRLKCGLVLTAQSFDYMMHPPLELITISLDQGGVYPLVEPVLGSCGLGVGIESCMESDSLCEYLEGGLRSILGRVKDQGYVPKGWWTTMDASLEKLPWWKRPKPVRLLKYPPHLQIRYRKRSLEEDRSADGNISSHAQVKDYKEIIKSWLKGLGLEKFFSCYRPYEFYQAGALSKDIVEVAKSVGLSYMFTKAGFNLGSKVEYMDDSFIALNYTAGQWDGWTPFETINDVSDLKRSERNLLRKGKPGWLVGTIDSCLWTFSGEAWQKGRSIYDIATFCAEGGTSKKLINVKPHTIARYARIINKIG